PALDPLAWSCPPRYVRVRPHQRAPDQPDQHPGRGEREHVTPTTPERTAPVLSLLRPDPGQRRRAISRVPRQSQTGSRAWLQSSVVRLQDSVPPDPELLAAGCWLCQTCCFSQRVMRVYEHLAALRFERLACVNALLP